MVANSYQLIYDMFQSRGTVGKQRFVDWFVGKALKPIWTVTGVTAAISDSVDGGVNLTTTAGSISFNNKRNFNPANSVLICLMKRNGSGMSINCGLGSDLSSPTTADSAHVREYDGDTYKTLRTSVGGTNSTTASDIAVNTNWTGYKITCGSADIKLHIDGVLKITKTTDRPTSKLQPILNVIDSPTAPDGSYRYLEVYNT